jgi:hypothetical protein
MKPSREGEKRGKPQGIRQGVLGVKAKLEMA